MGAWEGGLTAAPGAELWNGDDPVDGMPKAGALGVADGAWAGTAKGEAGLEVLKFSPGPCKGAAKGVLTLPPEADGGAKGEAADGCCGGVKPEGGSMRITPGWAPTPPEDGVTIMTGPAVGGGEPRLARLGSAGGAAFPAVAFCSRSGWILI